MARDRQVHVGAQLPSRLYVKDVRNAVKQLNVGIVFDRIHSNHFKYATDSVISHLTAFLNSCIIHSYFPQNMLKGVINPILKNRYGKNDDSNNYRELMVSSNFSKNLEYCLLPRIKNCISLSCHQFGYRKATSTLMATALLKETLNVYLEQDSAVYCSFLDLSKAFERVDHNILLQKLITARVPDYIVNTLRSIFMNGTVSVCYKGFYSESWKTKSGLRQGGILSL